jgi:hypothetical protein
MASFLRDKVRTLANLADRKEIYTQSKVIQAAFHDFLVGKPQKNQSNMPSAILSGPELESLLPKLGLSTTVIGYKELDGIKLKQERESGMLPIEIHKIRPAYRLGRDGMILEQVIVTITQSTTILIETGKVDLKTGTPLVDKMKFRGGCTIVFNMAEDFKVNYLVTKNIASQDRFTKQLAYQQGKDDAALSFSDSMYDDDNGFSTINFANLHFH